ncbi:MAG: hypothetical protein LBQ97_09180 [Fusobacteriaceae bacterium]|jgi:hypothetical protein|nr:hypothetical protein [Fusobacteriaceae bacterium]
MRKIIHAGKVSMGEDAPVIYASRERLRELKFFMREVPAERPVADALGGPLLELATREGAEVLFSSAVLIRFATEDDVARFDPETMLGAFPEGLGLIVTAGTPGAYCDAVFRFFRMAGPAERDVESALMGTLAAFWGDRLSQAKIRVRQFTPGGGVYLCETRRRKIAVYLISQRNP